MSEKPKEFLRSVLNEGLFFVRSVETGHPDPERMESLFTQALLLIPTQEESNKPATVSLQDLAESGLNCWAVQQLCNDYNDHPFPKPITFVFNGVSITLSPYSESKKNAY